MTTWAWAGLAVLGALCAALGLTACTADSSDPQQAALKSVQVFGVSVRATAATPDEKVLHAATVLAEYLDNDEDGAPDDAAVLEQMVKRGAVLIMAKDYADLEASRNLFGDLTEAAQVLYAYETRPMGSVAGSFDATLEEVLHLISFVGYSSVYPNAFGVSPGSLLADAMDRARGGRFQSVPDAYPVDAWFTYDDETCEYECQVTEYVYWALTSLLGAQAYAGRQDEIGHEWKLNTPQSLRGGDPRVYRLLSDPRYRLPTTLPDGEYAPANFTIERS